MSTPENLAQAPTQEQVDAYKALIPIQNLEQLEDIVVESPDGKNCQHLLMTHQLGGLWDHGVDARAVLRGIGISTSDAIWVRKLHVRACPHKGVKFMLDASTSTTPARPVANSSDEVFFTLNGHRCKTTKKLGEQTMPTHVGSAVAIDGGDNKHRPKVEQRTMDGKVVAVTLTVGNDTFNVPLDWCSQVNLYQRPSPPKQQTTTTSSIAPATGVKNRRGMTRHGVILRNILDRDEAPRAIRSHANNHMVGVSKHEKVNKKTPGFASVHGYLDNEDQAKNARGKNAHHIMHEFLHVYQETCEVVFSPSQVKDLLDLFRTNNRTFSSGEAKAVFAAAGGWKGHLPK